MTKINQVKDLLGNALSNPELLQATDVLRALRSLAPLKMAIAVTDTKHEAFHEPWVYFSFEKLKGTLWHDELSLELARVQLL